MKYILIIMVFAFSFSSCDSDYPVVRIDEFSLEQGGYIRTVTPFPVLAATFSVKKADLAGSKWEFVGEAVTPNSGGNFASYEMLVRFVDATPANGTNNVADKAFKIYQASSFVKDPTTGYPRLTMGSTGRDLATAVGLADNLISVGDRFEVVATMVLSDGRKFTLTNTGPDITGGAFYSSPFFYRVNVLQ